MPRLGFEILHTDGAARPLLKPILDCGVDVLNPIQHACPGMEMSSLKKEFGDRVIFHGGVDNRGTVFEIAKTADGYASSPTTLAHFTYLRLCSRPESYMW